MRALLLVVVGVLCAVGVIGYSEDPVQYHIQTDDGGERYFRYQTYDGQYRKEKRLDDGTVVGTYGWVDATGLLRLYDYVADYNGYRIVRKKTLKMPEQPRAPVTEKPVRFVPARTSFRTPVRAEAQLPVSDSSSANAISPTARPSFTLRRRPQPSRWTSPNSGKAQRRGSVRWGRRQSSRENGRGDSTVAPSAATTFTSSRRRRPVTQAARVKKQPDTANDLTGFAFGAKLNKEADTANIGKQTNTPLTTNTGGALDTAQASPLRVSPAESDDLPAASSGNQGTHTTDGVQTVPQTTHTLGTPPPARRRTQSSKEHLVERTGDLLIERTRDLAKQANLKMTATPEGAINRRLPEGGTYTINYDLGNQFHQEKTFADGSKVGKHGYVDPLGILRVTYYTSGPGGHQQSQESQWVGSRDPFQQ